MHKAPHTAMINFLKLLSFQNRKRLKMAKFTNCCFHGNSVRRRVRLHVSAIFLKRCRYKARALKSMTMMYHPLPGSYLDKYLTYLLIRFGTNLYRQIVGTPMGTNSVALIADFFFCYERFFFSSFFFFFSFSCERDLMASLF